MLAGARRLGREQRAGRALLREAERRLAAGQPARARAILDGFGSRPPGPVPVALGLLTLLRRAGELARARALGEAVLSRRDLTESQRARANTELACTREQAGDLAAGVEHLTAAVVAEPHRDAWRRTLAGWHHRIGAAAEQAQRWEAAAAAYQAAVHHDDTRAGSHYRLGGAREKLQQWGQAATAYQDAIARDGSRLAWHKALSRAAARAPEWTLARLPEQGPDGPRGVAAPPARGVVTGWIPATGAGSSDGTVRFTVNGRVVAQTRASREVAIAGEPYLEFRRNLSELWSYAGAGDRLAVEHAGQQLHIVDSGREYRFPGSESRLAELFAAFADGKVFNKYGRLRPSIQQDHEWQSRMLELFFQLRKELGDEFGVQLFPFYGTMLGAVREQNFIGHDNDFDTVYISGHTSPEAVREEFRTICDFLIDRGYSLRVKTTHTWVRVPGSGPELDKLYTHKMDIFFGWFDEDGYLQISYGHHGQAVRKSGEFFQFRDQRLGIGEVPVPLNAEDILAQLYGEGWREPDPGFTHFSRTRIMRRDIHLRVEEANEPHWRQFYRSHRVDGASSFAQFVAQWLPEPGTVLDIGCGSGRDTVYLATRGHAVVAADRSPDALERAREACQQAGADGVRLAQLDASSREDIARLVTEDVLPVLGSGELTVYLRFFLHSVEKSTEDTLLGTLVDALPGGFRLCAEFRTTQDGSLPKVYGDHYRRYIDQQEFADKLQRTWGFTIEHLEAGRGLSPYQGEDPHLARIVARIPGG
jgi:SAM-dependent methyltransferase/tetratricopeptide (TPR) repeat protein